MVVFVTMFWEMVIKVNGCIMEAGEVTALPYIIIRQTWRSPANAGPGLVRYSILDLAWPVLTLVLFSFPSLLLLFPSLTQLFNERNTRRTDSPSFIQSL